jgi:hypothetical protein
MSRRVNEASTRTVQSRSTASLASPTMRLTRAMVRTTGRRRATCIPFLTWRARCRMVSRSAAEVRWKGPSGMTRSRTTARASKPAPETAMGTPSPSSPSAPAARGASRVRARLSWVSRVNTEPIASSPISSVSHAWSAPERKSHAGPPDHLRGEDRGERRDQPLQEHPRSHQRHADDDGQTPAIEIGDDTGRDLEEEAGRLQQRPDQDHLQWAEAHHGDVEDLVECEREDEQERRPAAQQVVDVVGAGGSQGRPDDQSRRRITRIS